MRQTTVWAMTNLDDCLDGCEEVAISSKKVAVVLLWLFVTTIIMLSLISVTV